MTVRVLLVFTIVVRYLCACKNIIISHMGYLAFIIKFTVKYKLKIIQSILLVFEVVKDVVNIVENIIIVFALR